MNIINLIELTLISTITIDMCFIGSAEIMKTSKGCIELIKSFEGFSSNIYKDSGNVQTIGYGHVIQADEEFKSITLEQAAKLLEEDIETASYCVSNLPVELTQAQFDALVAFVYNVGCKAFVNSKVHSYLIRNDFKTATLWWRKWNKNRKKCSSSGLINRRKREIELFLGTSHKHYNFFTKSKYNVCNETSLKFLKKSQDLENYVSSFK